MADLGDLEARLKALENRVAVTEDIEAIKRLKHKYFRCLDCKLWDELAECFTEDATTSYTDGKYSFRGVDAIIGFLHHSLRTDLFFRSTVPKLCVIVHQQSFDLACPYDGLGGFDLHSVDH